MTLEEFKNIIPNIDKFTYRQVFEMIDSLGLSKLPAFPMPLINTKGNKRRIYRARKSEKLPFYQSKELSYNPTPLGFDRASSPCIPMFYGAISMNKNDIPMITNIAEISEIIRTNSLDYSELYVTFGEFELSNNFMVAPIIFNDEFLKYNSQYHDFVNMVKQETPIDYEIMKLFSYLFSLKSGQYYNNRLTAIFTDYLFAQPKEITLDAIIYPSVRLGGEGTNIAFHSEAADELLKLISVREYKIYMEGGFVILDLVKEAKEVDKNGNFELKENKNLLGAESCRKELARKIVESKKNYENQNK